MNRLGTAWTWIRSDPRWSALAGTIAVAAVAAGLAVGLVVTNLRSTPSTGSAASDQGTPSASAWASHESLSPSPSPSVTPSASASDEPSPSPDETPAPTTASAPLPTPGGGFGGGGDGQDWLLGTWEELAGGSRGDTSDSVVLPDGRIVVFRWRTDVEMPGSNEVTV